MPKTYSDIEKENIIKALRREASSALFNMGVKHTTIDHLVSRVHIPKGSFYLFYENKEELFFDMFTNFFIEEEEIYLLKLQSLDENKIVRNLTEIFSDIVFDFYNKGIYKFLEEENYELVMRKLRKEVKDDAYSLVHSLVEKILAYFLIEDKKEISKFIAALEAILYILPSSNRILNIRQAITLLIRGLVLQLVGE